MKLIMKRIWSPVFLAVLTSFVAEGANMKKPQVEIVFEILCEAEKRVLSERAQAERGASETPDVPVGRSQKTPREILTFLDRLAVSKHSFPGKKAEEKFYADVEANRKRLSTLFWAVAKERGYDKKSLNPRMERAENDASLRGIPSPCGLEVSEKLLLLSELF